MYEYKISFYFVVIFKRKWMVEMVGDVIVIFVIVDGVVYFIIWVGEVFVVSEEYGRVLW